MFVKRSGACAAIVAVAVLVPGCGGGAGDSGSSQGPGSPGGRSGGGGNAPVACTEIGCDSGLFLDLSPIAAKMPDAKRVKVCLESRCQTFSAKETLAMIVDRKLDSERSVTVTLTAIDPGRGRAVRLRESRTVRTVRAQPNGPGCPPVCFQVPLKLDPKTLQLERRA